MSTNRKEEIIQSAKKLFNQYGYHRVSMRMIADSLKISVGNITYYFPKKCDILLAITETLPSAKNLKPIESPDDLNALFLRLLHAMEETRFWFNDPLVMHESPKAYRMSKENIAYIYQYMKDGLTTLRNKGFFNELLTDEVIDGYVNVIMLAHLTWLNQQVNDSLSPSIDQDHFLQMHWALLNGYHNRNKRHEYHQAYGLPE